MHNGSVPSFKSIKLALCALLPHDVFRGITGTTDSEHIFALFLGFLPDLDNAVPLSDFISAVEKTMAMLLQLLAAANIYDPCSLNLVFSDGINVVATRFRSGKEAPPSLYYNYGSDFICKEGRFLGRGSSRPSEIVISSAPLSREENIAEEPSLSSSTGKISDAIGQWVLMPRDHLLIAVGDPAGKDLSVVSDVYLRPLDFEGYNFENQRVHLLIPPAPHPAKVASASSERDSRGHAARNSGAGQSLRYFAERALESVIGSSKLCCNRLRVVGSREHTPRGSLTSEHDTAIIPCLKRAEQQRPSLAIIFGVPILMYLCAGILERFRARV